MPIHIEIIYALPTHQRLITLKLADGSLISDAIEASGLLHQYPELKGTSLKTGIFSQAKSLDTPLKNGDRVEIYRPLALSPMERRRVHAKRQKQNQQSTPSKTAYTA